MAKLDEVLKHPDFWGAETTDEDRKYVLNKVPEFKANYNPAQADIFLKNQRKVYDDNQRREQEAAQKRTMGVDQLRAQSAPTPPQTMWQKAVAPVTAAVGRGVEELTKPLVPLARMIGGESPSAALEGYAEGGFQGAGGKAKESRNQAAGAIVPQTPWQAGAIGAQFVPGVGAAGAMGRVAGSMVGAGALQGLLGEKGVVEGGSASDVAREAAGGLLKGGATQAAGEVAGKALGGAYRMPFTGRKARIANADSAAVQKAVGEVAPEFAGAGKNAAEAGAFFKGTHGATEAASGAFKGKLSALEAELNQVQGHPYINTPELVQAYRQVLKSVGKDPVLGPQMSALAPSPQGFLPEQAAKIVSLTGQRLGANTTGLGHLKDQAMDDLVAAIERSLPQSAQGMLSAARGGYARAMGLQELLAPTYTAGKGYAFDIRKLQQALSEDPSLLNRLGKSELEKLFAAATRGASKGPGWADKPQGNISIPYPSQQGAMVAALRNLMTSGRHIGELPGTLSQGLKQLLGMGATSHVSSRSVPKE